MAQYAGSVPLTGYVAPKDTLDTYAIQDDTFNRGGYRSVDTLADMEAITQDRRKLGMLVHCKETNFFYTLETGLTNSDWKKIDDSFIETTDKVFYISTTGDDTTGDGSSSNPLASLSGVKKHLKRIIQASITIVFKAGSYTIEKDGFNFADFTFITTEGSYDGLWITGELVALDTVNLTNIDNWHNQDTSKSWADDEYRGAFVSTSTSFWSFPLVTPIISNTPDTLVNHFYYTAPSSNTHIVKSGVDLNMSAGDLASIKINVKSGSNNRAWLTYVNIKGDSVELDSEYTSYTGVSFYLTNASNNINARNGKYKFRGCHFYLKSRLWEESTNKHISFTNCNISRLLPSSADNTDAWFNYDHIVDLEATKGRIFIGGTSFSYTKVAVTIEDNHFTNLSYDPFYLDSVGAFITLRNRGSFTMIGKVNVTFNNPTVMLWGKYYKNDIFIGMKDADIQNFTGDYLSNNGFTWNFTFDGVAHSITSSSDTFDAYTKLCSVEQNRYIRINQKKVLDSRLYIGAMVDGAHISHDFGDANDIDYIILRLKSLSTTGEKSYTKVVLLNKDDTVANCLITLSDTIASNVDYNFSTSTIASHQILVEPDILGSKLNIKLTNNTGGDISITQESVEIIRRS